MASLVKKGFLKQYLEVNLEEPKGEVAIRDQTHETLVNGNLNTISGGFFGGGSSASKCRRYMRAVMSMDTRRLDHPLELTLYFTSSDLQDVVPHKDDPMVIFVITVGRKVHKVKGGNAGWPASHLARPA